MKTVDFDYNLPQELIAQKPLEPRDSSRLLVVDKKKKEIEHKHFTDIINYFRAGDLLVWNNSKVFKARLFGQLLSPTGRVLRDHTKPVEIFLVRPTENSGVWKVLAKPAKHLGVGMRVVFAEDFLCEVMLKEPDGTVLVQFPYDDQTVRDKANQYGLTPVPPYVKDEKHELESYQTVYAKEEGSVAAPTAGFHFTPAIIDALKAKGVTFAEATLHVGLGTFLPVKAERIEDHVMHSEWVELSQETADAINTAKQEGRRVVAVGTTSVRTLEGIATFCHSERNDSGVEESLSPALRPYTGDINLFITPGFEFQVIDALITNFHLPKSTLLMLIAAFAGDREFILDCYKTAVEEQYRFFSFGDAMFLHD